MNEYFVQGMALLGAGIAMVLKVSAEIQMQLVKSVVSWFLVSPWPKQLVFTH